MFHLSNIQYHYHSFFFYIHRRNGWGLLQWNTHRRSIPGVQQGGQRPYYMSQLLGSHSYHYIFTASYLHLFDMYYLILRIIVQVGRWM